MLTQTRNRVEETNPLDLKLPCIYTPESKELATTPNKTWALYREGAWGKGKPWICSLPEGKKYEIFIDARRYLLFDGARCSSKLSDDAIEQHYLTPLLQQKRDIVLPRDLEYLKKEYAQWLLQIPYAVMLRALENRGVVCFDQAQQKKNLFYNAADDYFYLETEISNFELKNPDSLRSNCKIPGRIKMLYRWDTAEGFCLQKVGFSNSILAQLAFSYDHETQPLSDEQLQQIIQKAYIEEIKIALKTCNNSRFKLKYEKVLKEIKTVRHTLHDEKLFKMLTQILTLILERIQYPENENNEEHNLKYAELASNLYYRYPQAKVLSEKMMPLNMQNSYARLGLTKTMDDLSQYDIRKAAIEHLQTNIDQATMHHPKDKPLTTQILWETKRVIDTAGTPENERHQQDFHKLSKEVNKRPWGKIIAGAILGVVCASIVGLCLATGLGAAISIPVIAWGLSYLIPTGVGSGALSLLGFGLFKKGIQEKPIDKIQEVVNSVSAEKK